MKTPYRAEEHSEFFRRTLDRLRRTSPALLDAVDAATEAPVDEAVLQRLWSLTVAPPDAPAASQAQDAATAAAAAAPAAPAPAPADDDATMSVHLRRYRNAVLMVLIERELTGRAPLAEVLTALSQLAVDTVRLALQYAAGGIDVSGRPRDDAARAAAAARMLGHDGEPQDLLVVGMGKLGGRELNPSSDVDLIFVSRCGFEDPEFITRLVRRTCALLAEPTPEGHVFRVDTRLRPYGDSGPPTSSLPMLEQYFYEQGREWERFAWLKGRIIAHSGLSGARAADDEAALMQIVTPFVYRRYIDYDAFAALARLHDLIRAESSKHEARRARGNNPGWDVKLGRGGIREIEFCAQLFQLVRGGQDPTLRLRSTPGALRRLGELRVLDPAEAQRLIESWRLLRHTENALQYRNDEQTHWLPDAPERRAAIAAMLGRTPADFDDALRQAGEHVAGVFDRLLEPARRDNAVADTRGLEDALDDDARRHLQALRDGRRYRGTSQDVRDRVERLLSRALTSAAPAVLGQMAVPAELGRDESGGGSVAGLDHLCDLLEAIIGRPAYLRVLDDHPPAFDRLMSILARGSWSAQYLIRHPIVIDELLDGQLDEPFDAPRWARELRERLDAMLLPPAAPGEAPAADVERRMDAVRTAHHGATFRLLAQDLAGRLSVEALGDQLSALADATLDIGIDEVWQQLPRRHRPDPQFAAIAYGKLGGLELGYASDLDLVFLFDDAHDDALANYALLAQRLSAWLSTRTAAGQLFDIDLRLRPNGSSGLLVSSVRAFESYQLESAWIWEHQALTRARYCAGAAPIGAAFEGLRRRILAQPREPARLAPQILGMRQKMHDGHPNRSGRFDLKHDAGGMVDIEFIVQYLVLAHSATHPDLIDNRGNIELLRRAGAHGLIDATLAHAAGDAYRRYRQVQHALRLGDARFARAAAGRFEAERDTIRALWQALFAGVAPQPPGAPRHDG